MWLERWLYTIVRAGHYFHRRNGSSRVRYIRDVTDSPAVGCCQDGRAYRRFRFPVVSYRSSQVQEAVSGSWVPCEICYNYIVVTELVAPFGYVPGALAVRKTGTGRPTVEFELAIREIDRAW